MSRLRLRRRTSPSGGGGVPNANLGTWDVTRTGWYTFVMAAPEGEAPAGVVFGALSTQNDIRSSHLDGSKRIMTVTCKPVGTGNHVVGYGTPAAGTFSPTVPAGETSVTAVISAGEVTGTYVATMPTSVGSFDDTWLDGPLVWEGRKTLVPFKSGPTDHPTARVIFDCRVYNDGAAQVDIQFINWKDTATSQKLTADFTIKVDGSTVLTDTATIAYGGGWARMYQVGHTRAHAKPDLTPYLRSGVIPKYKTTWVATNGYIDDLSASGLDDVLCELDWGGASKRKEVGIGINAWAICFLKEKLETQLKYGEMQSRCVNAFYGYFTRGDGVEVIDIDTYPSYYADAEFNANPSDGLGPRNSNTTQCHILVSGAEYREKQENAHKICALHFYPYLWTGNRVHYDWQAQYAMNAILQTNPENDVAYRKHTAPKLWPAFAGNAYTDTQGLIVYPGSGGNQIRGMGRGFQEVVNTLIIRNDSQGGYWTKAKLQTLVNAQLDWLDRHVQQWVDRPSNPLEIVLGTWGGVHPTAPFYYQIIPWTMTYLLHAIHRGVEWSTADVGRTARRKILNMLLLPARDSGWTSNTQDGHVGLEWGVGYQHPCWWRVGHGGGTPTFGDPLTDANQAFDDLLTGADFDDCPPPTNGYGEEYRALARLAQDLGDADGAALVTTLDALSYLGNTIQTASGGVPNAGHNWDGIGREVVL